MEKRLGKIFKEYSNSDIQKLEFIISYPYWSQAAWLELDRRAFAFLGDLDHKTLEAIVTSKISLNEIGTEIFAALKKE